MIRLKGLLLWGLPPPEPPTLFLKGSRPKNLPGWGGGVLPPGGLGGGNPQELTRAQGGPGPGGGHTRPSEDFPEASGAAATPRAPHFISEGLPPQKSLPVGGGGGVLPPGGLGEGNPQELTRAQGAPGPPGGHPRPSEDFPEASGAFILRRV